MDLPYYSLRSTRSRLWYTFYSEGPRGRILKVIRFVMVQTSPAVFNVTLGDVNSETGEVDTLVVSDNGDRDKILRTTAASIILFCRRYPQVYVLVSGNSPVRNRLYRMIISNRIDEVLQYCEIYGVIGLHVYPFRKNQNYNGFLVKGLKKTVTLNIQTWATQHQKKNLKRSAPKIRVGKSTSLNTSGITKTILSTKKRLKPPSSF